MKWTSISLVKEPAEIWITNVANLKKVIRLCKKSKAFLFSDVPVYFEQKILSVFISDTASWQLCLFIFDSFSRNTRFIPF